MNYLYNGVELPDIDVVWTDKETYPYALIGMGSTGNCTLYISNATGTYGKPSGSFFFEAGTYENPYTLIKYTCQEGGTNWEWKEQTNTSALGIPFFVEDYEPVLWSSYDTYDNEGGIYIEASEPIPVDSIKFDLKSWLTGYALGLAGKALPIIHGENIPGEKDLVAYLYNGVRFPAMPVWDKNAYPYAHIALSNSGRGFWFCVTNKALVAKNFDDGGTAVYTTYTTGSGVGYLEWLYRNGLWINPVESTTGQLYYNGQYWDVIWSNHDIKNENDGTIYLAASDPVPVYE